MGNRYRWAIQFKDHHLREVRAHSPEREFVIDNLLVRIYSIIEKMNHRCDFPDHSPCATGGGEREREGEREIEREGERFCSRCRQVTFLLLIGNRLTDLV